MGRSRTGGSALVSLERQERSLELRRAGLSYAQIGKQLNISKQRVHQYVVAAFKRLNQKVDETIAVVRQLESQRLDELFFPQFVKARQGDREAAFCCLKIMERRARMLGLDAMKDGPRIEITNQKITFEENEIKEVGEILHAIGYLTQSEVEPIHSDKADTETNSIPSA